MRAEADERSRCLESSILSPELGQAWVPEAGLYYYKARMYSTGLGRFMQTDPIGYADGMNPYAYVGNDPVNGVDPSGLKKNAKPGLGEDGLGTIVVPGERPFPYSKPDPYSQRSTCVEIETSNGLIVSRSYSRPFGSAFLNSAYWGDYASGGWSANTTRPQNDGPCPTTSAGDLATAVGHAETAHSAFEELADIENGGKYLRPIGVAGSVVSSTATAVDSAARGETMDVTFARIVLPAIGGIAGGALGTLGGSLIALGAGTAVGRFAGGVIGAELGTRLANWIAADAPRPRGCR